MTIKGRRSGLGRGRIMALVLGTSAVAIAVLFFGLHKGSSPPDTANPLAENVATQSPQPDEKPQLQSEARDDVNANVLPPTRRQRPAMATAESSETNNYQEPLDYLEEPQPELLHNTALVAAVTKRGEAVLPDADTPAGDDYAFPKLIEGLDGLEMVIPDDPLPSRPSRRMIAEGLGPTPVEGEVVAIHYDMFRWSTGELVESSEVDLGGPLMFRLGGEDTPVMIPDYLQRSIADRPYGSTVQVVFERGMTDLPGQFDHNDGYVLVVNIEEPEVDGDFALEQMMEHLGNTQ